MIGGASLTADHEPHVEAPEPAVDPGRDLGWWLAGALALLLAVTLGVGAWLWQEARSPGDASPEAGFARDMTDHHAQAVEMAMIVFERSDDPAIRQMAYDIAMSQQAQIGMMTAWLNMWKLTTAREGEPMAWASTEAMAQHIATHGPIHTIDDMPGMLPRESIEELRTLEPDEMDRQFLRLMTEHHLGGILMAESILELTDVDVVRNLAQAIVTSQTAEITNMQNMLAARSE